jgi:hypothetical protein
MARLLAAGPYPSLGWTGVVEFQLVMKYSTYCTLDAAHASVVVNDAFAVTVAHTVQLFWLPLGEVRS